jgi:hypothetical protein
VNVNKHPTSRERALARLDARRVSVEGRFLHHTCPCAEVAGAPPYYTGMARFGFHSRKNSGFGVICQEGKLSEEGEASRPSPTASFRSVPRRSPSSNFANLIARSLILAILFKRIHTPDTVDALTPPITAQHQVIFTLLRGAVQTFHSLSNNS